MALKSNPLTLRSGRSSEPQLETDKFSFKSHPPITQQIIMSEAEAAKAPAATEETDKTAEELKGVKRAAEVSEATKSERDRRRCTDGRIHFGGKWEFESDCTTNSSINGSRDLVPLGRDGFLHLLVYL